MTGICASRGDNATHSLAIPRGISHQPDISSILPLCKMQGSGSQIEIALRLQFRDPDYAASVDADEAGQQILNADLLRFYGVAAGGEFDAGLGKLADPLLDIRVSRNRVERPQRLAVHDKGD